METETNKKPVAAAVAVAVAEKSSEGSQISTNANLQKILSIFSSFTTDNLFFYIVMYNVFTIFTSIIMGISTATVGVPLIQIYFIITIICLINILINKTDNIICNLCIGILTIILACKYVDFMYVINRQEINYDVFSKLIFYNTTTDGNSASTNKSAKKYILITFIFSSLLISISTIFIFWKQLVKNNDTKNTSVSFAVGFGFIQLAIFINFCVVHYMKTLYITSITK